LKFHKVTDDTKRLLYSSWSALSASGFLWSQVATK